MKANELRIGNWVMGNKPYQVDINTIATHQMHKRNNNNEDYCQAITITKEWLVKFGFKKDYFKDEIEITWGYCQNDCDDSFYIVIDKQYERPVMYLSGYGYLKEITHVHQLQNLYFALTGEELTIKEN